MNYTQNIIIFLPMLYVAWADAVLTPSEIKKIKQTIDAQKWLTTKERRQLKAWLNPRNPPSDELLKSWVEAIRMKVEENPNMNRASLVDMGLSMAKIGVEGNHPCNSPEACKALSEIETALNIATLTVHRNIITKEKRDCKTCFDVEAMQTLLDSNYPDLRRKTKTILEDEILGHQAPTDKEAYRLRVMAWCKLLADQGFGALGYPKEYGGTGDMGQYIAVFETLGMHDLSLVVKFGVQFGLFGGSVMSLGTKRHHDKYLKDIGTLKLAGCFAMTEHGHGSNVRDIETVATYDRDRAEFVIQTTTPNAYKEYIGNALHGRIATVFAQLVVNGENHGVHALLVPLRDTEGNTLKGITIEDSGYKMGLNGVDNGKIWFDKVRVPRINLLNKYGDVNEKGIYTSPIEKPSRRFFTMLGTLVGGRVCVPFAGLSAAKVGLTIAIKYALKRRQFGADNAPETLLLDYPSHQRRLMPLVANAYALDFALTHLAGLYANHTEAEARELETLAAGLKAFSTWNTTNTLQMCREACGGAGYLEENLFTNLKADSDIFTTFEGDNTVLLQLVAKGLLTKFKDEFKKGGTLGMVKFIAERIGANITEHNPLFTRNTDKNHLLDLDVQLNAYKHRERTMQVTVAQRLRSLLSRGVDSYDAFLRCQNELLATAKASVECFVLEQFIKGIEDCKEESLKPVLTNICNLFALWHIEKNKAWYLENGYMSAKKTQAISRLVEQLCSELRYDALSLVDAFGIPKKIIDVPILEN